VVDDHWLARLKRTMTEVWNWLIKSNQYLSLPVFLTFRTRAHGGSQLLPLFRCQLSNQVFENLAATHSQAVRAC
jgi:hypothetical protein